MSEDKEQNPTEVEEKKAAGSDVTASQESTTEKETVIVDEGSAKKREETAADLLKDGLEDVKIRRAKGSKNVVSGICHILATFNNTKVTFSDPRGNVISWCSAGKCNFRGSRKSTAYAAQVVTQTAGRVAMSHGMKEVTIRVNGPGMGRDSAIRAVQALGLLVNEIVDVTPVPHNGCRPPKRRRV